MKILVLVALMAQAPAVAPEARVQQLERAVETLTEKIEYLRELVEALGVRVQVLEGRAILTTCKASMMRIPVSCRLEP